MLLTFCLLFLLSLTPFTSLSYYSFCFFFNDTSTSEIYTLSLHDALPISARLCARLRFRDPLYAADPRLLHRDRLHHALSLGADRKSTRLNSSHITISYAVFCLKKKKINISKHKLKQKIIKINK